MTKLFFVLLAIFCLLNPILTFADTVDVWTIKLNGKTIINSNQTDILYGSQPMKINLSSFADGDTLQICYWTDSGLERYKWYYFFKDVSNSTLDKFTNPIDSSSNDNITNRQNYISFSIQKIKKLMKRKNVAKILVEFQHDNPIWSSSYLHKPVLIISND